MGRRAALTAGALRRALVVVLASLAAQPLRAQAPRHCESAAYRRSARTVVGTVFVGGNAALYAYFRKAWWSGQRAEHMWINWEQHENFRQADKFGHALGGFQLARGGDELLNAACIGEPKAIWWSAAYAAAFQLQIELWDGTQAAYGFSPPDLVANTAGAAFAVAQRYHPKLRAIKPTFSYNATAAEQKHFGALRPTVDYSGQTYWLSMDVDSLLPAAAKPYWPGFLRFSLGRSITDWVNPVTGAEQRAQNVLVLSLDLDPERLPGNNPAWRRVKHELSYYRFPAPALILTPHVRGKAWYR